MGVRMDKKRDFLNKKKFFKPYVVVTLIIILFWSFSPKVYATVVTITSSPSPLLETNLNGATITINLSDEKFKNNCGIEHFVLNNAPTGLSVIDYSRADGDKSTGYLTLAFDGTDFDNDITNFSITVLGSGHSGGADVTSNDMTITAAIEGSVSLTASTIPYDLYEVSLDGSVVKLTLSQDAFNTTLSTSDLDLNNAPSGLNISNVTRINDTEAHVTLDFNGTDFDADINDFNITVYQSGLRTAQTSTSNDIWITAIAEIEGLGSYNVTGNAYPSEIKMCGFNFKENLLYINFNLETEYSILSNQRATFDYFVEVFDNLGDLLGNNGSIDNPDTAQGSLGNQSVFLQNESIFLTSPLPAQYRIVITVVEVLVTS